MNGIAIFEYPAGASQVSGPKLALWSMVRSVLVDGMPPSLEMICTGKPWVELTILSSTLVPPSAASPLAAAGFSVHAVDQRENYIHPAEAAQRLRPVEHAFA